MRPRPAPPTTIPELLAQLRAARLLSRGTARRLARAWGDGPLAPRVGDLIETGRLTSFQAERVLAGKAHRLLLGQYHLLERLGAGGMGRVYKAEHRLMKRVVALKIIGRLSPAPVRAGGSATPTRSRLTGFRREVQAAARLTHPHIVTAFDAASARGRLFLVMEYVDGTDLERLLKESGPQPVSLVREVARQMALALGHVHDRSLVHCDVKPANILLVRGQPGEAPLVKLLDLGLARLTDNPAKDEELYGTPDYIAPERGTGDPPDIRADLYSLGCTLYHLLAGQPPFPGGPASSKLVRHRLDTPTPLRTLRPEVPAPLAAVVECLMARAPEDRYPTPAHLLADLNTPVSSPPADASALRRFPGPVHGLSAVALGVFLAWGARSAIPGGAAPAPEAPPPPPIHRTVRPLATIEVEGVAGTFVTLAEALAAAPESATITLHGPGPFVTPPLTWSGKALKLRAAAGPRPRLARAEAPDRFWEALLTANHDLTLEGLELSSSAAQPWPLVCGHGSLRLTDCVLRSAAGADAGPLVSLRQGTALTVVGCRIDTDGPAVSVQMGERPCRVLIESSNVRAARGAALALWASGTTASAPLDVTLTRNRLVTARAIACRSLGGRLLLRARDNDFTFDEALFSFAGYPDESWRGRVTREGGGNRYRPGGPWLQVEGRPVAEVWRFEP